MSINKEFMQNARRLGAWVKDMGDGTLLLKIPGKRTLQVRPDERAAEFLGKLDWPINGKDLDAIYHVLRRIEVDQ